MQTIKRELAYELTNLSYREPEIIAFASELIEKMKATNDSETLAERLFKIKNILIRGKHRRKSKLRTARINYKLLRKKV